MKEQKIVYATAFNIKRTLLASKNNEYAIGQKIIADIILSKMPREIPKYDFNALKVLYIFMDNPELFLKEYFEGWEDTYTYLIESQPAYHFDKTCPYFLKDFYNIRIPEKIWDNNLVKEAREWSYTNRFKLNPKEIEDFKKEFLAYFNDAHKISLDDKDLSTIDRPNSTKGILKNEIEDIKFEIDKILKKFREKFTPEQRKFYEKEFGEKRYKYDGSYSNYETYIEHQIFMDLYVIKHSFIKPLTASISDYIFQKLNKENGYDIKVLDALNFRPCKGPLCSGDYIHIATL